MIFFCTFDIDEKKVFKTTRLTSI